MRKVILGLAITLDGFIEGPNGEYDWCFTDQDYGMKEFLKSIDAIFYGRKSYEMMMSAGANPFSDFKTYVFSNSLANDESFELVKGDIARRTSEIKSEAGKDIWLFGGASLTHALLEAKLVDELWLSVHPILLGKGKALFQDRGDRIALTLLSSKTYETGLVSLRYRLEYSNITK